MRWTAPLVCFLVLAAGCGSAAGRPSVPTIPRALAQQWAGEADQVAAAIQTHDGCPHAQQLAQSLATDIDTQSYRVPARLRATLLAASAQLAARITCGPKGPKPPKHPKPGPGHGHGKGGDGG